MKLRHLLFGLLAGVAFVACTNDDDPAGASPVNGGDKVEAAPMYMAVDLQFPGSGAATRAIDNKGFEPATTPEENTVTEAAFLFFNAEGTEQVADPLVIKAGVEYTLPGGAKYTWTPGAGEATTSPQGHKKAAVLIIKDPQAIPASLVVLVNSGKTEVDLTGKTVADLQGAEFADNFAALAKAETPKFVMSNSVYVAGGNVVVGTPIGSENIKNTDEEALADPAPVKVYVERAVAKVAVESELGNTDIATGVEGITVDFLNWGFAYENTKSNLVKKLGTSYDFGDTWNLWTDPANFRSYWADAPYDAQNSANASWNTALNNFGATAAYYTQENASLSQSNPTTVIVKAQLKYNGEAAQNLYKFRGTVYTAESLKNLMVGNAVVKNYYKAKENAQTDEQGNPLEFVSLDANDFDVQKSKDRKVPGGTDNIKDYEANVYLDLTATDVYTIEGATATKLDETGLAAAKAAIAAVLETVQYYELGKTYYFVPIVQNDALKVNVKKAATADAAATYWGLFGVVRNHFYHLNIKSVKGIGTAVPDPTEVIIPTIPVEEEYNIAAEINILDWKKVEQEVDLGAE